MAIFSPALQGLLASITVIKTRPPPGIPRGIFKVILDAIKLTINTNHRDCLSHAYVASLSDCPMGPQASNQPSNKYSIFLSKIQASSNVLYLILMLLHLVNYANQKQRGHQGYQLSPLAYLSSRAFQVCQQLLFCHYPNILSPDQWNSHLTGMPESIFNFVPIVFLTLVEMVFLKHKSIQLLAHFSGFLLLQTQRIKYLAQLVKFLVQCQSHFILFSFWLCVTLIY